MELKARELRKLSKEERQERLKGLYDTLLKERATHSMGGAPRDPGKIKSVRRQISRILTVEGEEHKK